MTQLGSNAEIRVAIVGYGLAGSTFHAPVIDAVDGMTVAAVVTRDAARQMAARTRYPDVHTLAEVEALWRRADEFDLVVVATPNRTHVPIAMAGVAARLAVVVDKPLAATVSDAQQLATTAARAGVMATVFHNRRWDGTP
jgi:scyllo-inositol 2-dehydrogenase (NADP+)